MNQPESQNATLDKIESIEFKDVWFRYPLKKTHWVLKGLNLKINQNESLAVVGESGAGKSTLAGLLLRFYDVTLGELLINGKNIKEYDIVALRNKLGFVMQEPTLFNYSVKENILYGNMQAKNSQIIKSAEVANALEFISSQEL